MGWCLHFLHQGKDNMQIILDIHVPDFINSRNLIPTFFLSSSDRQFGIGKGIVVSLFVRTYWFDSSFAFGAKL